ncbi:DUF2249 domain-containing protein [Thalassotalea sp. G2M2-11]|uniref:DUF2249 domain-containing protein n=1 Tax=Thalassotalea sp. G2M2-11 TaxID=2787627 RepID=UPI0019D21489|nr:DUF2249 domain-containing protein [Thalassotalea sp. G2M2-11]
MCSLVELDVSALAPPEPLVNITTALAKLANQQVLKVLHRREPFPLYEQLNAAGWHYHTIKFSNDSYAIYIFRPQVQTAAMALIAQDQP